jgi:AcrR family transcriptional regulator
MSAVEQSAVDRQHTAQGNERKLQLLEAARAVVSEHGFAKTRIADVCTAAGVAKGLFYWYFPTKQALFDELMRAMRQQLRRVQLEAMDPAADPVTRLRQTIEATLHFMVEHSAYLAVLDAERTQQSAAETFQQGADIFTADIRELIGEAQAHGQIPPGNTELYAVGVAGAASAFSHAILSDRLRVDADEVVRFAGAWIAQACATPEAMLTEA